MKDLNETLFKDSLLNCVEIEVGDRLGTQSNTGLKVEADKSHHLHFEVKEGCVDKYGGLPDINKDLDNISLYDYLTIHLPESSEE